MNINELRVIPEEGEKRPRGLTAHPKMTGKGEEEIYHFFAFFSTLSGRHVPSTL
jgi:hypothetical protein